MAQFRKGKLYHFRGEKWRQSIGRKEAYEMVIIGELVRTYLDPVQRNNDLIGEFRPDARVWRIDDGHLPDCQPRVQAHDLPTIMGPQAIRFAYPVSL